LLYLSVVPVSLIVGNSLPVPPATVAPATHAGTNALLACMEAGKRPSLAAHLMPPAQPAAGLAEPGGFAKNIVQGWLDSGRDLNKMRLELNSA
jgi:hypothetical protein